MSPWRPPIGARGLLTSMITGDLHDAVDRGDPLSMLIAAEYGIYGRFGYGPAIDGARYSIDTDACRFDVRLAGTVELVDEATMRIEAPPIYERYRAANRAPSAAPTGGGTARCTRWRCPGASPTRATRRCAGRRFG